MNSAIQCLSNTVPLSNYFKNEKYLQDICYQNPFGMNGEIVKSFGNLIKSIWTNSTQISPSEFKQIISKFAPIFGGFGQHDSQEFLGFLLDGLHEELNKEFEKSRSNPTENSKNIPTESMEIANKIWNDYLSKNKSIIIDLFAGQYKSKVCCPKCKNISVTYDPYLSITLPLPEEKSNIYKICIWLLHEEYPKRYGLKLPLQCSINELHNKISQLIKTKEIDKNSLISTEIFSNKITKIYSNHETLSNNCRTLMIYELPTKKKENSSKFIYLRVQVYGNQKQTFSKQKLFGHPFLILCKKSISVHDLYLKCWERLKYVCNFNSDDQDSFDFISKLIIIKIESHLNSTDLKKYKPDHQLDLSADCQILVKGTSSALSKIQLSNFTVSLFLFFVFFCFNLKYRKLKMIFLFLLLNLILLLLLLV